MRKPYLPGIGAVPGVLLDAGSGTGLLTTQIAGSGRVVGMDRSPSMLTRAARRPGQWLLADVRRPPFAPQSLGAVVAANLVHLGGRPYEVVEALASLVRPGGRLLLCWPCDKTGAIAAAQIHTHAVVLDGLQHVVVLARPPCPTGGELMNAPPALPAGARAATGGGSPTSCLDSRSRRSSPTRPPTGGAYLKGRSAVNEQVARPGQLTCINEECSRGGLFQPESTTRCAECGGPVGRVPPDGRSPDPAVAGMPGTDAGPKRSGRRLATTISVAIGLMLVFFVVRNPDVLHRLTGSEFATGDCVHVQRRLLDHEMERTECTRSRLGTSVDDLVYRVESVQDGKDGYCPGGPGRITFSSEPEDMTYCLVLNF
ncbi:MAG TPA: class I SAM-dependent methyltransferase [Micromonosporaceae bacterium]|nr:class I SAM-dependent methyltransferase [Micromonosporaceae bacterium]